MAAGSIVIDLLMRTGAFETDTKRAEAALKKFRKVAEDQMIAAGIAATAYAATFAYMAKDAINAMDQMNDAAQKTGIATEALSQLAFAAKMSGVETDSFTSALVKFNKAIAEGASGSGNAADAFKSIGISAAELKASSPDQVLAMVAEKFAGFADGANKTALAIAIFGRAGADLIPLLNEGATGISAMREEADKLGATINSSAAKAADQFNDNLDRMLIKMKSFVKGVASEVIPVLNVLMETLLAGNSLMNVIDAGMNLNLEGGLTGVGAQLARSELQLREADEKDKARLQAKVDAYRSAYNAMKTISGGAVTPASTLPQAPSLPNSGDASAAKAGDAFLKGLQQRVTKVKDGEIAMLEMQAAEKGVLQQALPLLAVLASNKWSEGADKFNTSLGASNEALAFQASLVGKTSQEVELLTSKYRIEADLKRQIADLTRSIGTVDDETIAKMTANAESAIAIQTAMITSRQQQERSMEYGMQRGFQSYIDNAGNAAKGIESLFGNAFKGMENAMVQFVMTGKMNFGDMVNAMIADLIRFQMQMAIAGLAKMAISAFAGGFGGSGGMSASTQAATYGGAKPMFGFADGGYTGDGGKYQPAGIVHAGEFVMNKESTSRIGVGNLYKMMRGYADGGLVGSSPMGGGANNGNVIVNIKNEAGGDGYQASATARKNENGINIDVMVRKAVSSDLANNGPLSQQMTNTFGLRRAM